MRSDPRRRSTESAAARPDQEPAIFRRAFCGIDGSPAAVEAARQLALLAPAEGGVQLLAVVNPGDAVPAGVDRTRSVPELEEEARGHLARAAEALPDGTRCESRVVVGIVIETLRAELEGVGATLFAVGAPRHRRLAGALLGSVASAILHRAPCSVLVARGVAEAGRFPGTIVVGLDGSPHAARALAAACELRERLGADVRAVAALQDELIDLEAARDSAGGRAVALEQAATTPVEALVASPSELLVVGSRGLRGLRALGSVSERVAHRSAASVLVVR